MSPLVDTIVVTYGRQEVVSRCLASLTIGNNSKYLRVFVVDNGSPDDTATVISRDFPSVSLMRRDDNPGFAVANNQALRKTTAPYILILNPDTEVEWDTIAHLVSKLEDNPDIGVIGCRLVKEDGSFDHASKRSIPTPKQAFLYFFHQVFGIGKSEYLAPSLDEHGYGEVDAVNGAFMLIRREALDDVGGLDEQYWMYGEDLDWCTRFRHAGWKVMYDGTVTALHIKGASSDSRRSWRLNYHFHRSMAIFYRDHMADQTNVLVNLLVYIAIWLRCIAMQATSTLKQVGKAQSRALLNDDRRRRPVAASG